jgi:hypothetical protein
VIDGHPVTGEGPAAVVREPPGATAELVQLALIIEERVAAIVAPPATNKRPAAVIEEPAVASAGPAEVTE